MTALPSYTREKEIYQDFKDLSPTDCMLQMLIQKLIWRGADKLEIYQMLDEFDSKDTRYRMNKRLKSIFKTPEIILTFLTPLVSIIGNLVPNVCSNAALDIHIFIKKKGNNQLSVPTSTPRCPLKR
jgi:hypothetical protein